MSEETTALARIEPVALAPQSFGEAMQAAAMYSKSGIVPAHFRDQGACMIAMEIAQRLQMPLMMVMQNLYVVHGQPSWKGSFCKALVDRSTYPDGRPRFAYTAYEWRRDEHGKPLACRMVAEERRTGKMVEGAWITLEMVRAEKWGAKWQTMPEQMYMYRVAAFFLRAHCPDAILGLPTMEEVIDVEEAPRPAPMADAQPIEADAVECGDEVEAANEYFIAALQKCGKSALLAGIYRDFKADIGRDLNESEKKAYLDRRNWLLGEEAR
jgi:hypothetical protein